MNESDEKLWGDVDHYLADALLTPDPALDATLAANAAAGLPAIDVSAVQGKFLHLMAKLQDARRILEIGTLGGYSTIWMARALPAGGKLITLEADPKHAEVARQNLDRAGLASLVELKLAPALDSLAELHRKNLDPFDLIFIDADKPNNPNYLDWAIRLSRPGTLIICDNVIREGAVIDADSEDPAVQGTRQFFEKVAADSRLQATAIQTVGAKGYDGFAMILVR